ncbi:MAG: thymidine kinase, partial [Calditrichia bacterium]|nr:thymidine kinase [Calditrichia bacterium]
MFSGKTEELIRRVRRAQIARQKVELFKPAIDTRYSNDEIVSHDDQKLPSRVVKDANEMIPLSL